MARVSLTKLVSLHQTGAHMHSFWMGLAVVGSLLGTSRASAQTRTVSGDTVWAVVHHVRPDVRAGYDSLMQQVWWPVALAAGKKYPGYGKQLAERRRYVPT